MFIRRLAYGMAGLALLTLSVACGAAPGGGTSTTSGNTSGTPASGGTTVEQRANSGSDAPRTIPGTNATAPPLPPGNASFGTCDVTITGSQSVKYTGLGGRTALGSDYWFSPEELRTALRQLTKATRPGVSDADIDRDVAQQMQQDPRLYALIVNCVSGGNSISLLPGNDSKYADIPFGPKRYAIASGGPLGTGAKKGEFAVLMTLDGKTFQVDEPGVLNLTKFDATGIAGTFAFKASEFTFGGGASTNKVGVEAKFDYKCVDGSVCRK